MSITNLTLILVLFFVILFIAIAPEIFFQSVSLLGKRKRKLTILNRNNKKIFVDTEIADSLSKKAKGLMFRKHLGEDQGMLFPFNKSSKPSFWMLGVSIPLEALFFSEDGVLVDIIKMNPGTNPLFYKPKQNAKYVLEVNQGFSEKNNITLNSKLSLEKI